MMDLQVTDFALNILCLRLLKNIPSILDRNLDRSKSPHPRLLGEVGDVA